jgi:O-6-methylguanine DNA methyltransferase
MRAVADGEFELAFQRRFGRPTHRASEPPAELRRVIEDWMRSRIKAKVRFDLRGLSEFEQAVLYKALEIPPGEVRPYAWIAREIGRPRAVRAVGSALGGNPIPLLIPCHRVVRSDGHVGQYALGADAKRAVLAAEGTNPDALDTLARAGTRFYGSDTTRIFCFPTCRHARRVTDAHRVTFRSELEAETAGYRPCKVCRPA